METKNIEAQFNSGENGMISGYAATWTREPDSYGDVIAKGAFSECIKDYNSGGRVIPLLWNHESDCLDSFIGLVTLLKEDDHGLYFEATFDGTESAQRVRRMVIDKRLSKFSFAFDILDRAKVTLADGRIANELRKLNIYEVSLTLYPANPDTSVVDVKTIIDEQRRMDALVEEADRMLERFEREKRKEEREKRQLLREANRLLH